MKKITTLVFLFVSISVSAQHLKYVDKIALKYITLTGSIKSVIDSLKSGYEYKLYDDYCVFHRVKPTRIVAVEWTPKTKQVYLIKEYEASGTTWELLFKGFAEKMQTLENGNGEVHECHCEWEYPYKRGVKDRYSEYNGRELEAIQEGKCEWRAIWDFKEGLILVEFDTFPMIRTTYRDEIGYQLYLKEED